MAIIPQQRLFGWKEIEKLGDLERLKLVLETMPDEDLMQKLEDERGRGRNDYPVRAVWNSILAGVVYQHPSIESLRRELMRNGQLRYQCGFYNNVPPSWVYSRFLNKILECPQCIENMFYELVEELGKILPGFGSILAIDGKAIQTHAKQRKKEKVLPSDGRRDTDANLGVKTYRGVNEDGTAWEKVTSWFGYRLHLIIDATYELPVAFHVTKASNSEVIEAHKMLGEMSQKQPEILAVCKIFLGDRGYDDSKLIKFLWDEYWIKPVIDIRNMWKDGEKTRLLSEFTNVVHDYRGNIFCYCPETGKQRAMAYGGFEKDRETLKYRCPAKHYGINCKGIGSCPVASGIRIPLSEDRRVFTPLARSSYSWETEYKKRTAVERVNSRLDVSFGFENHFIKGLKKMNIRCGLALCVMLSMALGRAKANQFDKLRSLVKSA
jgi:transposase